MKIRNDGASWAVRMWAAAVAALMLMGLGVVSAAPASAAIIQKERWIECRSPDGALMGSFIKYRWDTTNKRTRLVSLRNMGPVGSLWPTSKTWNSTILVVGKSTITYGTPPFAAAYDHTTNTVPTVLLNVGQDVDLTFRVYENRPPNRTWSCRIDMTIGTDGQIGYE